MKNTEETQRSNAVKVMGLQQESCLRLDRHKNAKEIPVDCSNLYLGQDIKNYKNMCLLLGEVEKAGDSKIYQIKNWERYFDFEKVGQHFIIKDIYEDPLPKIDGRITGNNSIYVQYIQLLLMKYLSNQPGYECQITKNDLYYNLCMVNNNYLTNRDEDNRRELYAGLTNISKFDVYDFYRRVPTRLDKILFSALNSMKSRCLIEYGEEYVIVNKDGTEYIADSDEVSYILKVKKRALAIMGLSSIVQVYYKFLTKEFYEKVNKILRDECEWLYAYKRYKIIFIGDEIRNDIPKEEAELVKNNFNAKIAELLDNQAASLFNKNIEDYYANEEIVRNELQDKYIGEIPQNILTKENHIYKLSSHYKENQSKLVNFLIKLNANMI